MILALALAGAALLPQEPRPTEYWRAIVASGYAVPAGESAYELVLELSRLLGSTDSELRDDFGYAIPADWIWSRRLFAPEELRALAELWSGNLERGLDGEDPSTALLRSFSALDLSLVAALDNDAP